MLAQALPGTEPIHHHMGGLAQHPAGLDHHRALDCPLLRADAALPLLLYQCYPLLEAGQADIEPAEEKEEERVKGGLIICSACG